jgi:hypothetical protein
MRPILFAFALLVLAGAAGAAELAIADFAYVDTSGETADQTAAHRHRLDALMAALKRDLAAKGSFHLVTVPADATPPEQFRAAAQAGARILLVGGIHKLSTLVQWAKVEAVDVKANRVIFDRLFTFRGDSDDAWERAELFLAREVAAALAPVRLALFEFELEDYSAAGTPGQETAADRELLRTATEDVRRLLAQSGRYALVDTSAAETRALHDCDGCDAAIALSLGAEQSFVGVVRRISRTEYLVRFRLRDARTGAVLSEADSGLRMGADYSWSRGAARLVTDRLLDGRDPS